MTLQKSKKRMALILILTLSMSLLLTGFTYQSGIGNVYYETNSEIFYDTYFHKQLAGHGTNGIERAYIVTSNLEESGLIPYVFEGEVTGTYTMNTMINTLESQGYKVVAGINGDIYDTSSGTPKGTTIHDGTILTSGYAPEYVVSFDEYGKASLARVNLSYSLKGTINLPTLPGGVGEIITVPTEFSSNIGFFNVPHGGAKGLHLYNRQYASTTKTKGNTVEVILEAGTVENSNLRVGGTITATVVEVRTNTCNTPIGSTQLVLSTVADSAHATRLSQLVPGSTIEIGVNDVNGQLTNSKESIGTYYLLYDNGQYVTNGTNINPRTVMGIKPDGTVLLYVLDGRQPNFSAGLGLTDTAKHLVDLGCTTVVNLDGGGSSVIAVREGGLDGKAVMKNSPSDKTQRKTTNGFFLVYKGTGNRQVENLHAYPNQPLAMPGADVQITTYASDSNYESLGGKSPSYRLADDSYGSISEKGLFTAGSNTGKAVIEVESDGLSTTTEVEINDGITFTTNIQNLVIDPGKISDINVTAKYGYAPIASKDNLFTWSCDPLVGTIDQNGLFTAVNKSGVKGNIYVEYKNKKQTIPVQVGSAVDFADTKDHWAREYILKLAAKGVVSGVGDNYFKPDDTLTRAQFLTMLAKTIYDLDVTKSPSSGFTDVNSQDWFYGYVNWGFESGIVKGIDEKIFAPDASITREQMAIMLNNFTTYINVALPQVNSGAKFTDADLISLWAQESVDKVIGAGIMGGHPEGNFEPQGKATRAQAATVIYKYSVIKESAAKK